MTRILRLQDLILDDVTIADNYQTLVSAGSLSTAINLINSYSTQSISSEYLSHNQFNTMVTSISTLENDYYVNVPKALSTDYNKFENNIDNTLYVYTYSSTEQYYENNFVDYNNDIYFAYNQPEIGNLPSDTSNWEYLGIRGLESPVSLGVSYTGDWDITKTYSRYDMITYNNDIYVSYTTNTGVNPFSNSSSWLLAVDTEPQPIYLFPQSISDLDTDSIFITYVSGPYPYINVYLNDNLYLGEWYLR